MAVRRYVELSPRALAAALEKKVPSIVPIGALEWHGDHLPLGLDGLVAEAFAELLAESRGAVLLPTMWLSMTTLPHWTSLQVQPQTFESCVRESLEGLLQLGFRDLVVITGHYAQGQMVVLYRLARRLMQENPGSRVFAATPLEPLGNPDLLDHAARYETSQLLHVRPEWVQLSELRGSGPHITAVMGGDPQLGSAAEGAGLFSEARSAWISWMDGATATELSDHYIRAESAYQEYIDRYRVVEHGWNAAIVAWWQERGGRAGEA